VLIRVTAVIAVTVASAAIGAASPASAARQCREGSYTGGSGDCVHRAARAPAPRLGATPQCADGCDLLSEDPTGDDTCHGRGGAAKILQ
jgi:hypothetical protein